jgi:hypothetical protein
VRSQLLSRRRRYLHGLLPVADRDLFVDCFESRGKNSDPATVRRTPRAAAQQKLKSGRLGARTGCGSLSSVIGSARIRLPMA